MGYYVLYRVTYESLVSGGGDWRKEAIGVFDNYTMAEMAKSMSESIVKSAGISNDLSARIDFDIETMCDMNTFSVDLAFLDGFAGKCGLTFAGDL